MEKYSLGSIKRDGIRRVFACIKKKDLVSRLEISKETGLSLMTVGKIADDLADKNIITQQKGNAGSVGRKANYISLNKDNFSLILDLSSKTPAFAIVNVCGKILYSEKFDVNGDASTKDFFEKAKTYADMNYLLDPCMGIGVVADGNVDFAQDFRTIFNKEPDVITTSVIAKAADRIAGEGNALYFEISNKSACGAYSLDGELCDINGIVAGETVDGIVAVTAFLSPEKAVLDGDALICEEIKQKISKKCKKTEAVVVGADDKQKETTKYAGCAALVADEYINITK